MNDIRRTILWVIFGFSMVLLWDQWQVANGKRATFFPGPAVQASAPKADGKTVAGKDGAVPAPVAGQATVPAAVVPVQRERHNEYFDQCVPGRAARKQQPERDLVRVPYDTLRSYVARYEARCFVRREHRQEPSSLCRHR